MLRIATVAVSLAMASSVAAAPCAVQGMQPTPWKPLRSAEIPGDGGIVVKAISQFGAPYSNGTTDPALQARWKLGGKAPAMDLLAPGLAVYRVAGLDGPVNLTDDKGRVVVQSKVLKSARGNLPPAPVVKSVVRATSGGRRTYTSITVTIDGDLPVGTVAVILATEGGKPLSWGHAQAKSVVYAEGGCGVLAPGTVAANVGDKVTALYVDETGHISAPSKSIVVTN